MKYKDFLSWVDMPKFAEACNNICHATVLNESTNRMMKEKFIIGALQKCNHQNNIDWTDERDFDVKFTDWENPLVEVKTGNTPLFSPKTGKPKKQIKIKLKNVYESKSQRTNLDKLFDHLMIVQIQGTVAVGFVDYDTVKDHLVMLTDGFLVKMPFDLVKIVYTKDMRDSYPSWQINFDPKTWVLSQLTEAGL